MEQPLPLHPMRRARLHDRRHSRSRRIGRGLDRLRPCRADHQEEPAFRKGRHSWRRGAGEREQRHAGRCAAADPALRHPGLRLDGCVPRWHGPDRNSTGAIYGWCRPQRHLFDHLVAGTGQHHGRGHLHPARPADLAADHDPLPAAGPADDRTDLLCGLPGNARSVGSGGAPGDRAPRDPDEAVRLAAPGAANRLRPGAAGGNVLLPSVAVQRLGLPDPARRADHRQP